jgi:hypothetical protein
MAMETKNKWMSNALRPSEIEYILSVDNDDLTFQRKYSEPLRMRIKDFGTTQEVYKGLKGPLMIEGKSVSEVMFPILMEMNALLV